MNEKQLKHISKFLSLVLRHKPEIIGIELDNEGWTDTAILLEKMNQHGTVLDLETLCIVVETNNKKRFAFNDTMNKIRANQGHSVTIELGYANQKPPEILYHGTAQNYVVSILESGLEKKNRHHVHLSTDLETALKVGQRHGKPVIFEIQAEQMYNSGFEFFLSDNGVWLTDHVPVRYLKIR